MKTNLKMNVMLATALFIASAGFSQTSSASANATTEASATVPAGKVKSAEQKTKQAATKTEEAVKKEVKQDRSATVSASDNTAINASAKDNKITGDASLNSKATVSTATVKEHTGQVKERGKTIANTTVKAVKPKPVTIKTQARINTGAGVKIK